MMYFINVLFLILDFAAAKVGLFGKKEKKTFGYLRKIQWHTNKVAESSYRATYRLYTGYKTPYVAIFERIKWLVT